MSPLDSLRPYLALAMLFDPFPNIYDIFGPAMLRDSEVDPANFFINTTHDLT